MLKNVKTKLFLVIFATITLLITPFSFAEDETATNTNTESTENAVTSEVDESSNTENPQSNQEIHEGDLYLTGNDITMDKLVNGNVYIAGNNVKVTGQIAGNLFLAANQVEFENAYIEASAYICAKDVKFQAVASDLYICSNNLEIPENYGVYRDLRSFSNKLTLLGIIGRDAYCSATDISISQDDKKFSVYGDFNYITSSEIEIPEGAVEGNVNYTQMLSDKKDNTDILSDYIIPAISSIVFVLVIYGLALLFAKSSIEKCTKITSRKFLPAFGIGFASLIVVPIVSLLLVISAIGAPLAFALLAFYGLLISLATPVFLISIANIICNKMKKSNKWIQVAFIALIALLIYIIGIIPYVSILKFLIVILGFGILIMNMFFKNIKFEKTAK